jgi:hypothetical protein
MKNCKQLTALQCSLMMLFYAIAAELKIKN